MSKRVSSEQEQLLAERLRREAIESRPAFSESLHRRIFSAVRQRQAAETSGAAAPTVLRRWPRVLAAALAAACLLCAVAVGWRLMVNASRQSRLEKMAQVAGPSIDRLPSIGELTDHAVARLDHLTVSAALEPQTAPLKHDAMAVAGVFLDRLPVNMKLANNQ